MRLLFCDPLLIAPDIHSTAVFRGVSFDKAQRLSRGWSSFWSSALTTPNKISEIFTVLEIRKSFDVDRVCGLDRTVLNTDQIMIGSPLVTSTAS
jgi:hypothetical protein